MHERPRPATPSKSNKNKLTFRSLTKMISPLAKPVFSRERGPVYSLRPILLILGFLALIPRSTHAQVDTGAIVGTVQDSAGANIPDATVTVTEEGTGRKRPAQTGQDGSYIISPLKLGTYTLTAEKQGFKTSVQDHIQVTIQSR